MDWQTFFVSVLTSLFTSSAIAAGLAYLLKRSFDKALDLKYEKMLEKFRLSAKEETRRSSELYDLQAKAFREILTQVYRIRNSARKIRDLAFGYGDNEQEIDERIVVIRDQDELFSELLYVYRAILPDDFFRMAHEVNHQTIKMFDEHYARDKDLLFSQLPEVFEQIDLRYRNLIGIVQNHLGIKSDNSQYSQHIPGNPDKIT